MNPCSSHARTHREVERMFTRGLPRGRHTKLRDHLRDCDRCRSHYERVRGVEDALFGNEDGLNPAALERLGDLIVEPAEPVRGWRLAPAWTLGLATAAAALLLFVALPQQTQEDGFAARGEAMPAAGGLSLFRVDPADGRVERLARQTDGLAIATGSVIQMAYTNTDFSHAVVLGLDADLDLQWYHPTDVGGTAVGAPLRNGEVDAPFGTAWKLDAKRGPLRLFILFTRAPIDPAAVTVAVEALRREGVSPRNADRLPGIGAHQDTVLLELR